MPKRDDYRNVLRGLADWDEFLLRESGLPGPRGNLELAQAVAEEGDEARFARYLQYGPEVAPTNSREEFLAFCGAVGLGRLLAEGRGEALITLRRLAADPRWRMREAVAMALQRYGERDMDGLLSAMRLWAHGTPFEQRAAAAALCEPRLLDGHAQSRAALDVLDEITNSVAAAGTQRGEGFETLRKGLAYCWSVAVASLPEEGKPRMEKWLTSDHPDIVWIMQQNLRKKRLERMDSEWVARWRAAGPADRRW